jgi:hypothetical protein
MRKAIEIRKGLNEGSDLQAWQVTRNDVTKGSGLSSSLFLEEV